jgi:hypothetical protein
MTPREERHSDEPVLFEDPPPVRIEGTNWGLGLYVAPELAQHLVHLAWALEQLAASTSLSNKQLGEVTRRICEHPSSDTAGMRLIANGWMESGR